MSRRERPVVDEFTIPRPRWIVPVALIGAALLFLGVVVGVLVSSDDDPPAIHYSGTTTTVVAGTAVVTTTVP
jgi:hypothetical protein